MVMVHREIAYSVAVERGGTQGELLDELTQAAMDMSAVDYTLARALIESRLPLLA